MRGVVNTSSNYSKVTEGTRMSVKFFGNYVKENKLIYLVKSVVNIYIVYSLYSISNTRNTGYTIQNALFGRVKRTEDPSDSDNNKYVGCGTCFDEGGLFSFGNIVNGRNVIIFGCDMSFSSHERNRQNEIYVLGEDFIQGVTTVGPIIDRRYPKDGKATKIYAEKLCKHNFTEPNKKFVLSLHDGDNTYLFVNGGEESKFKTKTFSD